jgi:catalase-peroxidase
MTRPANAGVGATIAKLEEVKAAFGKDVSIADLIVLGGCVAVEDAAKKGGVEVTVPFSPGR